MTLKRIILTSRPMMWPWLVLIYLVGVGNLSNFSALGVTEILFFTFPLNFYLYGFNDIYDVKTDRINARKRDTQGLVPEDREVAFLKKTVWIPVVLFIIISLFSRSLEHIILCLAFVILSFTYSYKGTRFKEIVILDCLNSATIYLMPGLIAYSLRASIFTLPWQVYSLVSIYAGIHAITTLIDVEPDKKAGMKTTGTVLGKKGVVTFCLIMVIASLLIFWNILILKSIFVVSAFMLFVYLVGDTNNEPYLPFAYSGILICFAMATMVYFILLANSF